MQTIDSLPMPDLSHFTISAIQNILRAQLVSNPKKKEQLKWSPASVQARKRKYYWTPFQQRRYVKFLMENTELCSLSLNERKSKKVNHLMSRRVKSRNPAQCHTHHQKMLGKFKDISAIIQHHRHLFDLPFGPKSDTTIIQSSYDQKYGNQLREWKSVDQILQNIGLYEKGERKSERLDHGAEMDGQEFDWLYGVQREWIDW